MIQLAQMYQKGKAIRLFQMAIELMDSFAMIQFA
jgi:hypothetical protein